MDAPWIVGSYDDALAYVAERRVLRRFLKEAELGNRIQDARQELGVLGAEESKLNEALQPVQAGDTSPGARSEAERRMRGSVPGISEQLSNVPAAIGVAAKTVRPGDALAQADVLGLKNVTPFTSNFSVPTALAAAGAGAAAHTAHRFVRQNQMLNRILYGHSLPGGTEKGKDGKVKEKFTKIDAELKGVVGENRFNMLREHRNRSENMPHENLLAEFEHRGAKGLLGRLRTAFTGPKHETHVGTYAPLLGGSKPEPVHITRQQLAVAAERAGVQPAPGGRGSRYGLPFLAALLPLLYREWLGSGYRSGKQPIKRLVDANAEVADKRKAGVA